MILKAIADLSRAGSALNCGSIEKNLTENETAILSRAVGFSTIGRRLVKAGRKVFGTWDAALEAAGFDPLEIITHVRWTRDEVLEVIRDLDRQGFPLNAASVSKDSAKSVSATIERLTRKMVDGNSLYIAGQKNFGSWDAALEAAGLNARALRVRNRWTPAQIVDAIQVLHEAGLSLSVNDIQMDASGAGSRILTVRRGRTMTTASLVNRAYEHFGGWDEALRKAGLNPAEIRKRGPTTRWSGELVVDIIRRLARAEKSLAFRRVRDLTPGEFAAAIESDRPEMTSVHLLAAARRYFGFWASAVTAAGFEARAIRFQMQWSKPTIVKLLSRLASKGLPLSPKALRDDASGAVMLELSLTEGRLLTGYSLLAAARRHYDFYGEALEAAGLDARQIVRQTRGRVSFAPFEVAGEWVKSPDSRSHYQRYLILGEADRSPHEDLESGEIIAGVRKVFEDLDAQDRQIIEVVLEIVDENGFESVRDLYPPAASRLGREIADGSIEAIFARMAKHPSLRGLRL